MKRLRRLAGSDEGGQSLVEFALVVPVMFMLIFGLIDVGRAVWQSNTLAYATREATRYAIVHGAGSASPVPYCSSCTNATITAVVEQNAIGVSGITVTVGYPDGNNDRGSRVFVDATAPFVPMPSQYLLGGALTVTLRGGSMLVIQR